MKNRTNKWLKMVLLLILALGLSPACNKAASPPEAAEAEGYAVDKEYDRGEIHFQLRLKKDELTLAEKLSLELEVTADKKYFITFPDVYDTLSEQFLNIETTNQPARVLDNGQLQHLKLVTMEPMLSGEYKIPPLTFQYWTEEEGEENAHLLETDEIPVTIKSILPADLEKLEIKDLIGPLTPPPADYTWLIILIASVLVAGGGGTVLGVYLYRKNKRAILARFIPAHELAFRDLETLVSRNFIDAGEYKLFYNGISTILRHYIEDRFGLHAPESTTEEFLAELKYSDVLDEKQKRLLSEFLTHCDMVKFAELVPDQEQIQMTFDSCKHFILETKDVQSTIEERRPLVMPQVADNTQPPPELPVAAEQPENTRPQAVPAGPADEESRND